MEGSGKTEWSRSGMAGRKRSLIQMQDRSISAVTFTSLNVLSYPLPMQQAEALVKSKQLKSSLALRTKPALLGVFGMLGALPVGVPSGSQPHSVTPSPNTPTLSFYLASSVGIQPLLSTLHLLLPNSRPLFRQLTSGFSLAFVLWRVPWSPLNSQHHTWLTEGAQCTFPGGTQDVWR